MSDDIQRKIAELRESDKHVEQATKFIKENLRKQTADMHKLAMIELEKLTNPAADPATQKDVPRSRTWRDYFRWFGR